MGIVEGVLYTIQNYHFARNFHYLSQQERLSTASAEVVLRYSARWNFATLIEFNIVHLVMVKTSM